MKPIVQYLPNKLQYIVAGFSATVHALDHPQLGEDVVCTSTVLSYDSNTGEFETLNTRYVPVAQQ